MLELEVKNPYTDETLAKIPYATREEIGLKLARSVEAFHSWRTTSLWTRAQVLNEAADRLSAQAQSFAELICQEAGKPIFYAQIEVNRGIEVLRWAASEAQRFSGELISLDASGNGRSGFGIAKRFPKGVILGITPFNFPLNLALHKIAPALASGCTLLIKPSPSTPLTTPKNTESIYRVSSSLSSSPPCR